VTRRVLGQNRAADEALAYQPIDEPGAFPGSGVVHLGVVLGEVRLHPIDVVWGEVDTATRSLHDRGCGHDAARHGVQSAIDDVGDEQLVGAEVVLPPFVVPDVSVSVLVVRTVLGAGPRTNA